MRPRVLLLTGVLLLVALNVMAVEPGGPSYLDIANQAYQDKDWAKSSEYYQKWVEADPSDEGAWYNLACTLALSGRPKESATALLNSVEAGWRGRSHTEQDPDLNTIRSQPDYAKALARIDELAALEKSKSSAVSQYARQTRLSPYWVRLPYEYDPNKAYPLVILLHGRGGNPQRFIEVANSLDTLDFVYAAPQAPYSVPDMRDGFQYFPAIDPADSVDYAAGAELMTDWVIQVTKDISSRYKIRGNKFWVVGFSQGGAAAHLMGLFRPDLVAGYAALGGYVIDRFATSERFEKMKRSGVKVFIGHGTQDQVVTPDEAVKARDRLQDYEINVSYHTYPAGHTLSPELRQDLTAWLQQQGLNSRSN